MPNEYQSELIESVRPKSELIISVWSYNSSYSRTVMTSTSGVQTWNLSVFVPYALIEVSEIPFPSSTGIINVARSLD